MSTTMLEVPPWLAIPGPHEILAEPWRRYEGPCTCDRWARVVYTLHFVPVYSPYPGAPGYKTAGHYTGTAYACRLAARLAQHRAGYGARLTQVQLQAGGDWCLGSVLPGGYDLERRLKRGHADRRCVICLAYRARAGRTARARIRSAAGVPHETADLERILG